MNKYECPNCNKVHTAAQWNHETALRHNEGEEPIPAPLPEYFKDDETFFRCPACWSTVFGHELHEIVAGETDEGYTIMVGRIGK